MFSNQQAIISDIENAIKRILYIFMIILMLTYTALVLKILINWESAPGVSDGDNESSVEME